MTPRMNLLSLGVAAGLALASAVPAFAQTPPDARVKLAREVVDVSGAAASFNGIVPIFLDEAKRALLRTQPPEYAADFDAVIKILQPEFEGRREQLLNDIAVVYSGKFSDAELNDIKTFFLSPTGKKYVQIQPGLLQAAFAKAEVWSRQMTLDVTTRMRQEMKKRGRDI